MSQLANNKSFVYLGIRRNFLLICIFVFFICSIPDYIFAANRYWVGGCSTSNWNCSDAGPVTNWGSASNTRDNASIPGSSDDVFFDGVGNGASNSTLSAGITIKSLDMTGFINTLTHNSGVTLTISGSGVVFKFGSGMTYSKGNNQTSAITFTGASGTTTITTAGRTLGGVTFNGTGTFQLQDNLTTSNNALVTLTQGKLDVNNVTITAGIFVTNSASNRTLALGSGNIRLVDSSVAIWNGGGPGTFTMLPNTGTTTFTASPVTDQGFVGASTNFNGMSLVINGATTTFSINITGGNVFRNLVYNGSFSKTDSLVLSAGQTVTGTLTLNGNTSANRLLVRSDTFGTNRTINAANVSVMNTDFRNITAAGAANWDLSSATGGSGDAGGNTGITFTTGQDNYWVADTGNWSDSTKWKLSDHSTAGRVPLPQDNVRFDSSSFTGASKTVTLDMPRAGKNIDWTGVTNNPAWAKTTASSIYGSVTMVSGMTNSGTASLSLEGRSANTWTNGGQTFTNPITISMIGGSLTFQDDFNSSNLINLFIGTLDANNHNATMTALTSSNTNTRTLTMGSGIWALTSTGTVWNFVTSSGLTLNAGTGTTTITNTSATAKTFAGGGLTWNNVSFLGDNITVTGSNTFNLFGLNNAGMSTGILLTSLATQTISSFITNGSSGNVARLLSTSSGVPAAISKASGSVSADYMSIKDSRATGGATWNAGSHSIDVSGNTGWTFSALLTVPVLTADSATSITATTSVLNGTITDTGGENNTVRGFQYGTTVSYGYSTSTTGSYGTGSFALTAGNLLCNTLYHYRSFSTNGLDTGYSSDATFTTSTCPSHPTQYYASPTGNTSNNGTYDYPWTLKYVLSGAGGSIQPGDTVYLRGGTYTLATTSGDYGWTSTVSGTASQPIVFQSYPGEWAVMDGNLLNTATKNNTVLLISGNYVWFRNFEITNSETDNRAISTSGSNPTDRRGNSIDDRATGTKLINLIIHDTGQGIGGWSNGNNNEYYGNVIYNNGWDAPDRTHGHAIYTQNTSGWKRYFNNVVVNAFSQDLQVYDSGNGSGNEINFTFEGNTWMNNLALFGGDSPLNNLRIDKNYFFRMPFQLGYSATNDGVKITSNYFASTSFSSSLSKNIIITKNIFVKPFSLNTYIISLTFNAPPSNPITDYVFDENTYYATLGDIMASFYVPPASISGSCGYWWFNSSSPNNTYCGVGHNLWQNHLGYDASGTFTASLPTSDRIFYRKNKYDPDRETITVFNWDGNSTVSIDPSQVLNNGDTYELHNTQDYFGDVITGTYNGSSISVSMTGRTLAKPIGYDQTVAGSGFYSYVLPLTTFPTFGTFVLVNTTGTIDTVAPLISNVASTTTTTSASISWDTDEDATTVLEFGTTASYGNSSTTEDNSIYGTFYTTTHEITLAGLSTGTTYHYHLTNVDYAGNSRSSSDYTFTTTAIKPTVTTSAASSVDTTSASLNGQITSTGGSDAIESGFAYSTSATLVSSVSTTTLGAQGGTASFSSNISSLSPNTTYYFRAYATNSAGTSFGSIQTFTTSNVAASPTATESTGSVSSYGSYSPQFLFIPALHQITTATLTVPVPENNSFADKLKRAIVGVIPKFFKPKPTPLGHSQISPTPEPAISLQKLLANFAPTLFSSKEKTVLPTETVFVMPSNLTYYDVSKQNDIHVVQGRNISLSVKIDKPVKAINGYLTVKKIDRVTALNDLRKQRSKSLMAAAADSIENRLVVGTFSYEDPDGDGIYTGEVMAPKVVGEYDILTVIEYKDQKILPKELHMIAVIDPEGYVYHMTGKEETRISGAIVKLFVKDSKTETYVIWPSAQFKQTNPQTTDKTGSYAYVVPQGTYKLSVFAEGYYDFTSGPFIVSLDSNVHENIELTKKSWIRSLWEWLTSRI